jgi:hypothetical protein
MDSLKKFCIPQIFRSGALRARARKRAARRPVWQAGETLGSF